MSCFLVADAFVTFALFYMFYLTYFNMFVLVILVIQLYLLISVFSFWQQLRKEHEKRMENLESRRRDGQNQGYVRQNAALLQVTVGTPEMKTFTIYA